MTVAPMAADQFWGIIERTGEGATDPNVQSSALRTELLKLSLEEIISFEASFRRYLNEAYSWDIWGAADLMCGRCSDDCFEYFRRWLISRGRAAYEAALANPDSLAGLTFRRDEDFNFEAFYYVANHVYREKGGKGDVRDFSEREAGMDGIGPTGEKRESSYFKQRYPKLWQKVRGRRWWPF